MTIGIRKPYLNPMVVDWFNEWQKSPDLMGISDLSGTEEIYWVFFISSMFDRTLTSSQKSYSLWLEEKLKRESAVIEHGIVSDMLLSVSENYLSNFKEPFPLEEWTWHHFLFIYATHPPQYPPLFRREKKFASFMNWNENPLEVKG